MTRSQTRVVKFIVQHLHHYNTVQLLLNNVIF